MSTLLKQFLNDFVASKVTISEQERMYNVQVAKNTVDKFISCMKEEDPLFGELYQRIYYSGSIYEGLKVGSANKFDHYIVLDLPFNQEGILVIDSGVPKGFVTYKLRTCCMERQLARHQKWPIFKDLDDIMDPTHQYLSHSKLNAWFQSIVVRTFLNNMDTFSNVKLAGRAPAKSLIITVRNGMNYMNEYHVRVNLVPVVLLIGYPESVTMPDELNDLLMKTAFPQKPTCFIVPVPPDAHIRAQCEEAVQDKILRVSIPEAEKLLMADIGCVKMLIKIFKALRDAEGWTFLPSYYIKTVFMRQLVKYPKPAFWRQEDMAQLFIMMLIEFIEVMKEKRLDHIFFEGYNLLQGSQQFIAVKIKFEKLLMQVQSDVPKLFDMYSLNSLHRAQLTPKPVRPTFPTVIDESDDDVRRSFSTRPVRPTIRTVMHESDDDVRRSFNTRPVRPTIRTVMHESDDDVRWSFNTRPVRPTIPTVIDKSDSSDDDDRRSFSTRLDRPTTDRQQTVTTNLTPILIGAAAAVLIGLMLIPSRSKE